MSPSSACVTSITFNGPSADLAASAFKRLQHPSGPQHHGSSPPGRAAFISRLDKRHPTDAPASVPVPFHLCSTVATMTTTKSDHVTALLTPWDDGPLTEVSPKRLQWSLWPRRCWLSPAPRGPSASSLSQPFLAPPAFLPSLTVPGVLPPELLSLDHPSRP